MSFDRKYVVCALIYAAIGICLGIFMAASHDHGEFVTHAHILLIGFVLSFAYGIIHKLWLGHPNPAVAKTQFFVHQAAAITISVGLFLLYGNMVSAQKLDPLLGVASALVLVGALLMLYMVLNVRPARA
jgi:predicted outer membrane lipoprotein